MKRSLISAIAGLTAGAFTQMVAFAPSEVGSRIADWIGYFLIGVLYGAPLIAVVWLCVLWPLYAHVPMHSILWHPVACILAGAVAGALLYLVSLRVIFRFPAAALLSVGHLLTGVIVGAVTCAVGCYLKRHEHSHQVA